MSSKHNVASRLLGVFTLATLSLATAAEAQPYGRHGGGMMGGDWGWGMGYGMGSFGGIGVLVIALVVLGIAVVTVRRRNTVPAYRANEPAGAPGSVEGFGCNTISPRP